MRRRNLVFYCAEKRVPLGNRLANLPRGPTQTDDSSSPPTLCSRGHLDSRLKGPGSINLAKIAACPVAPALILMACHCIWCSGDITVNPASLAKQIIKPIFTGWAKHLKKHCARHAYALMTNHVHLLVTPDRADAIPRLIIALE